MKIDDSLVQYAHDYIKTIIEKFGPRYSCSKQEHDANEWTKNELATFCDEVTMEDFKTEVDLYPMGIIKVVGTLGTLAAAFIPLGFGLPFVATALIVLALLIFYEEMFLVGRWIRPFFKKGTSSNTWGVVKPEKEVKWRVIIDGHVDSAKQMRIAEKESISAVPLIFGFLYLFYTATIGIVKGLGELLPGDFIGTQYQNAILHWSVLDWVYFIPIIFLMPCLFYIVRGLTGDTVVPGASDNLSGCAVAAVVARYFNKNKLNHVEVIAGSFGSEECGDMGAKDFAARHGDLFKNGYSYCIEEASTGIEFQIIEKDFHTRGRFYAPEVIERMEKAVARHARDYPDAYPVTRRRLPFGSSNASMYLLAGYKAGWIVSVGKREQAATPKKKGTISKPANWHSMRDTWTAINKQTLRDSIGMAIEFCKLVDEEQGP